MTDLPSAGRTAAQPAPGSVEALLDALPDALSDDPARASWPYGPRAAWPVPLQYAVRFLLDTAAPGMLCWGPDARVLYNDAAALLLGERHPALLGQPMHSAWPGAWAALAGPIGRALAGESFQFERPARTLRRAGAPARDGADLWLNLAFAPLRGLDGAILGVRCTATDVSALRDSEARFRVITDAMPHMVWSTLPDGYHDYYNRRWYEFTGMREGETDGELWATMFHEDDRAAAWQAWRHALATGDQYEVEYRLRHHSGAYRWVLGRALPIRDAQGRIVRWMGTCTDIDEQKRSEAALHDAQLRLSAALVAGDIGTWTYDLLNDRVVADRNLAGIFGVGAAQAAGGPLAAYLDAVHPDDLPYTRACIAKAVADGSSYECTYRVRGERGAWRHVLARGKVALDAAGRPAWLPGVVLDITLQKRAELALRQSESRFRRLAESNVIGIMRFRLDGAIIEANQAFLDMLGYTQDDVARGALSSQALTPDEWREPTARVLDQLRRTGRMENLVKEYFRKDGSRATVQMGAITVDDAVTEGIAVLVDISGMQAAQRALREADRRKDEFLAMLAHELRNPLAPIMAAADFLKVGQADAARIRQVTAIIARQAGHMTGLIDDLLDVSRVTRGLITLERAPVAVATLVAEAVEQVRPQVEARRHRLALAPPAADAFVFGDHKRLVQIFANLLGNAAKYTPEGGRIAVDVRLGERAIEVAVSDNGIGMSAALVAQAFELFSQGERSADRSQGGLGIGLALVRSLVELHDGGVRADSAGPGHGSRFTVTLPRYRAADPLSPDALAAGVPPPPAAALDVLIVDDNVDAAQILAMYIEAVGHRATVWHSPGKALAHVAARAQGGGVGTPDVAVLDIGLPEFDGHELARRLRALPGMARIPLVALSGYGQAQDRANALAAGFDRHFVKPVRADDILAVLAEVAQAKAAR